MLEACREAGVARVLSVASADVYGIVSEADLPLDRGHPHPARQPLRGQQGGGRLPGAAGVPRARARVMRVRAFNHIGPGQSEHFVAPAIAARIARNELDGGDEVRSATSPPGAT